jgi:phosphomannomutase
VHASGGLFVTGSGAEPAWTGLDFLWEGARPASAAEIAELRSAAQLDRGPSLVRKRPTRSAGTQRTFPAAAPYEESLAPRFADLRIKKIACASSSSRVGEVVQRMLKRNPECEVLYTALPVKIRNPARRRDEGILQLSQTIRERQAQLGILFDDDGQRCGFVDERGRHVSSAAIARLVVPPLLAEQPGSTVVLEPAALVELRPLIEAMGGRCQSGDGDAAAIAAAVLEHRAVYGGGDTGRHWFFDGYANCDALVIVAHVLAALSRADQPFSQLAAS